LALPSILFYTLLVMVEVALKKEEKENPT